MIKYESCFLNYDFKLYRVFNIQTSITLVYYFNFNIYYEIK